MTKLRLVTNEKTYAVHSSFITIQGEGYHAGRRAVFIRFSGCNVWNGRDKDRNRDASNSACAYYCDTEFFGIADDNGGGHFTAKEIGTRARILWGKFGTPFIVCTGGEPGLQLDDALVRELQKGGGAVAVETNGSRTLPVNVDWITLSPKFPMTIVRQAYDEVKLLYPLYEGYETQAGRHASRKYLQPVDPRVRAHLLGLNATATDQLARDNVVKCLAFINARPEWRLSLQIHKYLGVQ